MNLVKEQIIKLLQSAGVSGEINLSVPPKPEMGDLAFVCFDLSKEWKSSPPETAKKLAALLKPSGLVAQIQVFGPYVNFFLDPGKVAALMIAQVLKDKKDFGKNNQGNKAKVLIEYPSNNTHKELHIGHLRNICIGNCLVNLFASNGFKPLSVNYINDFGSHVAKCLWGLMKFHGKETPPENKQKWLGDIYAQAARYLEKNPEDKKEVAEIQLRLEKKDKAIWPLYKRTRKWSLKKFAEIYKELGVNHKKTFFEQDIKELGQKTVDALLKKGIAKEGEGGAVIVDLSDYNLDIALLRKSDGAGLYLTADLGLALRKNKIYPKINESIYITGQEQSFYFKQLFKILSLAGCKFKMTHIGYGLVNLPSGKMSSREGTAVLYEDLFKTVYEKILQETITRHQDWSKAKAEKTARLLAFSAIKFDFLKHESNKVIVFNPQEAVSFDGFTGPYVLYALARMNSILKKAGIGKAKNFKAAGLLNQLEEKQLALIVGQYGQMVEKAFVNYNPSVIAKYVFDLAKQYNDFYSKHSVLQASNKESIQARLVLTLAVKTVLENGLRLLSIEPVEEM